jgi:hypothetical protein
MNNLMEKLVGKWFIISSDFPLWLKGDRESPVFNYKLIEKKGHFILSDEVSYLKNGKTEYIKGYDFPDSKNNDSFIWRGKSLLFFIKSRWQIKLMDEKGEWAVIWFSKTIFTPEGVDVISRNKAIGPIILSQIKEKMAEDET